MVKMNMYALTRGLLSIWLCVACACASDDGETEEPDAERALTTGASFSIRLIHLESSTSTIEIEWQVPEGYPVKAYHVESKKLGSEPVTTSPRLSSSTSYLIEDLMTDSKYDVCVIAHMEDGSMERECEEFYTIATIRQDSVVALIIALGYIVVCALVGYIVWKCHKRRLEAESEVEEDEEPINPKEGNPDGSGPIRSSIEDEDIPYITPPVDQLTKEDQERYHAVL